MMEVGLVDIPCSGPLFTWSKTREHGYLARKLDRGMANAQWLLEFTDYEAQFLAPDISDHSAGMIVSKMPMIQKCGPFKFFNYLIQHKDFYAVVQQSWDTSSVYGTMTYQLSKKLKALKPILMALSRDNFQGIHSKVDDARRKLHQVQ